MICDLTRVRSIKAVLFDCDGTLVESEGAHFQGWRHALRELGGDLPAEEYHHYVGKCAETNAKLLAERIGIDCFELIMQKKREYHRGLCQNGFPPIQDTVDFLKNLAAEKVSRGLKIGVCSASRKDEIISKLRYLQIEHLIDIVLSGKDDMHEYSDPEGVNKPKPYIYLHAMKLLGVCPANTVVIEDSAPGAAAGVAAGCFTVVIPNEYTLAQDFSHAHLRLESLAGINVDGFFEKISQRK